MELVPDRHWPLLQQPLQEDGPQALDVHWPFTHCWPLLHVLHCAPPVPQALAVVPDTHLPFWQHPVLQVDGPHEEVLHAPLMQA